MASSDRRLEAQLQPASQHPLSEHRPHRLRLLAPNRRLLPSEQVPPLEQPLQPRLLEPPQELLPLAAPPLAVLRHLVRRQPQLRARVWEEAVSADLEQLRQQVRPVCSALQRLVQHHQLLADSANRQLRVQRQQVDFQALAQPQRRHLLLVALAPASPLALGAEPSDPVS